MRILAHVEKILKVEKHDNADKLDIVDILGWRCITKLGEFKIYDDCVYIEIDSILPEKPEYEFLRQRKFRIKTQRIRGFVSQGLAMPVSILPPGNYKEGQDVTEILKITHYDKESPLNQKESEYKPQNKLLKFLLKYAFFRKIILPFIKKPKGAWPLWVSKTDEERIQGRPGILERYKDEVFYVTEKVDYQSITFFTRNVKVGFFKKKIFGVCSRNMWLKTENDALYWKQARKYNIEKILRSYDEELTIQAESGDVGVQKNKYEIKEPQMWIFNIINNRTGKHFSLEEMEEFCKKNILPMVPVLDRNFKLLPTVNEMVEYSKGKSVINSKIEREGIVVRSIKDGQKISFKAINPNFLLKYDSE